MALSAVSASGLSVKDKRGLFDLGYGYGLSGFGEFGALGTGGFSHGLVAVAPNYGYGHSLLLERHFYPLLCVF